MTAGIFTLGGVIIGSLLTYFLTRSLQRGQWLHDGRKEEFRELLGALSKHFAALLELHRPMRPQDPEEQEKLADLSSDLFRVIHNRIFVAADVDRLDLENKWMQAANKYRADFDIPALCNAYHVLNRSIVNAALGENRNATASTPDPVSM